MKKTFIFFIAYLILLTSSESFSKDLKFLFTEDQNTVSENISDIVKSKNDISIHK